MKFILKVKEEHLLFHCVMSAKLYDFVPVNMISVPLSSVWTKLVILLLLIEFHCAIADREEKLMHMSKWKHVELIVCSKLRPLRQ